MATDDEYSTLIVVFSFACNCVNTLIIETKSSLHELLFSSSSAKPSCFYRCEDLLQLFSNFCIVTEAYCCHAKDKEIDQYHILK